MSTTILHAGRKRVTLIADVVIDAGVNTGVFCACIPISGLPSPRVIISLPCQEGALIAATEVASEASALERVEVSVETAVVNEASPDDTAVDNEVSAEVRVEVSVETAVVKLVVWEVLVEASELTEVLRLVSADARVLASLLNAVVNEVSL